ncbi:LysR family transcriptional regulator [Mesoterricola silvestris]|uniref:Transcriptional regulator n=1 Tax=Mesoterricola silvestris TaxID=2927979 RepID=A0AA48GWL2_9BACT|nr:LysR family transcriptional regulator [Mesoterricola silvestris]BDU71668.1 transcriptional regulator [Mesoterricola silvestris]
MTLPSALDPRRLETFRVVADMGQVSAASRLLNLSQPAVTAQIRLLEAEAGQPLFTRHAGGVRLTEAGLRLLDYARRIHALLEEAVAAAALAGTPGGQLHLAASTTTAGHVLPGLFQGYGAHRRCGSVRLEVGNTEEVLAWVREGRVGLGMVEGLTRAPGVSLEPFLRDELVAVRPVHGPFAEIRSLRALVAAPLLWREEGSGTRTVVERAFAKAGLRVRPRDGDLILGDTEAIKTSVLAGLGIGFLSRWSIQSELRHGELEVIPVPDLAIHRTFSWVQGGGGLAGEAQAFLRWARSHPPSLAY